MGQKVNPKGFRLQVNQETAKWQGRWFADKKKFPVLLLEDFYIRQYLDSKIEAAGLVRVDIERYNKLLRLRLLVAKPGIVIGRGGKGLEEIKKDLLAGILKKITEKNLDIQVEEYKTPDLSAKIITERIAYQLANRLPHRRVVSKAIERTMAAGAKGIKIVLAGRIGGAEIGRSEKFSEGSVSLSTLRSNIDYYEKPSHTRSGYIGVKVYVAT